MCLVLGICEQSIIFKFKFNIFSDLQIYGNDTISMYRGKNMGDLDPHVYAVAEEAFKRMERYLVLIKSECIEKRVLETEKGRH